MSNEADADVVIWRNCTIGAPDAETDRELLSACFVNNGCLDQISDPKSHSSIIVGRTGSGKSATLIRLEQTARNVISISPSDLSFRYVENSTVLKFFRDAGVNLDVFYRMLWRHVLITELLKARYDWDSEQAVSSWFDNVFNKLKRDPARSRALRYLQDWGDKFWQDTEVRVKEVTEKVESELKASISASAYFAKAGTEGLAKLSEEEKSEICTRGSSVVNKIQLKELAKLFSFMADEVFNDDQKPFYVTIDNLDENWVSSSSKFLLIRSLIEEIKSFKKIKNVKIIIALRQDLLETVYNETRDGGFQEEKYEAYYAPLKWNERDLIALLETRINEVFRKKYTGRPVKLSEILPKDRGSERSISYILERTFLRPRDVISFVNECLALSEGKPRITWALMFNAEEVYSQKRFRSVLDEWTQVYPSLKGITNLVRNMSESFVLADIKQTAVDAVILKVAADEYTDSLGDIATRFFAPGNNIKTDTFVAEAMCVLYHVGVIGLKRSSTSPFVWAYRDGRQFSAEDVDGETHFRVHKMFLRELGVMRRVHSYDPEN